MADPNISVEPGPSTTEFWKALAAFVAGLVLVVYGVISKNDTALIVGGSLSGVATAGYSISRGLAKAPLLLLVLIPSIALNACAGTQARNHVGVPALELDWDGINPEAVAGAPLLPSDTRDTDATSIRLFQEAMTSKDANKIVAAYHTGSWYVVRAAALADIDAKQASGTLGPGPAGSLRQRVHAFEDLLAKLANDPVR